jgi:hypothetical protein
MAVVAFNYGLWAVRYPELSSYVPQPLAQAFFNEAQLYCDNTATSPIKDDSPGGVRATFLNMITAHIAALNAPIGGQPASPLVGRINSATEGSVSAQAQYADQTPGSMAWFVQTKYGAAFWEASAGYRTMKYVTGPRRVFERTPQW